MRGLPQRNHGATPVSLSTSSLGCLGDGGLEVVRKVPAWHSVLPGLSDLPPLLSSSVPQEQHRRLGRVRLQPQRHLPGLQRALQVPGELTLRLAALSQPQPQLPGNFRGAAGHSVP